MVIAASFRPTTKSSPFTAGKSEESLASGVGSRLIFWQRASKVGAGEDVSVGSRVEVEAALEVPQAERNINMGVVMNKMNLRIVFLHKTNYFINLKSTLLMPVWISVPCYRMAAFKSSKDVIHAMRYKNSDNESLRSRSARTAGPTGSSPAAPPGISAYAP
jgi:hypothetical protein